MNFFQVFQNIFEMFEKFSYTKNVYLMAILSHKDKE